MKLHQLIILLFIIKTCTCSKLHRSLERQISELRKESALLYGNRTTLKYDALEDLAYPKTDKRKIIQISQQWLDYYDCSLRLAERLVRKRLPSTATCVFEGANIKLSCGLCLSPKDKGMVTWWYAESPDNLTLTPLPESDTIAREQDGNITLYHTGYESSGVYRCSLGDSYGGLRLLEVVAAENYSVVKPPSSRGPYAAPPQLAPAGLTVFSAWSEWSGCSRCDRVGRRRRYGMCAVGLTKGYVQTPHKTLWGNTHTKNDMADLFQEFPDGIPCRSKYLPEFIRDISAVQERQNEIMIGLCKVPCDRAPLKARSHASRVNERVYITGQFTPVAVNDVLFLKPGDKAVVKCPGTTRRNQPYTWRVGSKEVVPRDLDRGSGGRLYINAMDHVVITSVQVADASLYSCWQAGTLAGTVKLVVWQA